MTHVLIRDVAPELLAALDFDAARRRKSRQQLLLDLLKQQYGFQPSVVAWLKADRIGAADACAQCGKNLDTDTVWIGVLSDGSLRVPVCSGCAEANEGQGTT